jgi:hypothetical protein
VLRKYEGKSIALIYVVYVPDTKDDNVIDIVTKAVSPKDEKINTVHLNLQHNRKFQKKSGQETFIWKSPTSKNKPTVTKKNDNTYDGGRKKINADILNKEAIKLLKERDSDDHEVRRINKAFQIVENTLKENSLIIKDKDENYLVQKTNEYTDSEPNLKKELRIYKVKSTVDNNKTYIVDLEKLSCTCADYLFRRSKCKHILATEFSIVES